MPAPAAPPQAQPPSWQELHERNMARLRELAAAWEKAREEWQQTQERDDDGRSGKPRGRGNR